MAWITAKNGNVLEVSDPDLVEKLRAEGHGVSDTDPRETKTSKK
jgi:hypothetical protein